MELLSRRKRTPTADVSAKTQTLCTSFPQSVWQRRIRLAAVHLGPPLSKTFSEKAQAEVDD
ncbi:MAG: hypothetical protein DMG32_25475 [Acidobacteria bacterium]|nr:MAG: hypothetical protein DMG32_25475 [Acidobacteriota bacterium]